MIAGLPVAEAVFEVVDPSLRFTAPGRGRSRCCPRHCFWRRWKAARTVILSGERLA